MNVILLSGGSGKRLWPLSNEIRSKQFLKVVKSEDGKLQSMLQRVFGQIKDAKLSDNVVITTSKMQVNSILSQLGNQVEVILEPERRDTFPAIALSSMYILLKQRKDLDEVVVVLPVDPYVDIEYFYNLKKLEKVMEKSDEDIILMGVKPTYPSEKYGYIIPKIIKDDYMQVKEFKEKPTKEMAQKYIKQGALWNCGVFAFRLRYIFDIVSKYIKFQCYEDILNQYKKLKKTSFDYEVLEKAKSVGAISYDGKWKDMGTWNTLTEVMDDKERGKVVTNESCLNTHIINELEIPIIAMGTKDLVIVASPDGILVSNKEQSSYLKECADKISQRPMFEELEWGEYKVLDISIGEDGIKALTKRKIIRKGGQIPYQLHKERSEVLTILNGNAIVIIDGNKFFAKAGNTFSIPIATKHKIIAVSDVELLEVQVGTELWDDGTEIVDE